MKDEIEELYGAMREREEASWDPLLRNYYAGYCDALRTVYSLIASESGRRKRITLKGIEETAKEEETGKEPPEETGQAEVRCKQCGKLISTDPSCRKKYCDDCLRKRKTERKRKEREKMEAGFSFAKEDLEKQARTNAALNEAARIQKETGISYGQQMARKWQREEKR